MNITCSDFSAMETFPFGGFFSIVGTLVGFGLYFMPTIVAWLRDHPQKASLFVLNLFLGWTVLGWIGCLAWSVAVVSVPKIEDVK